MVQPAVLGAWDYAVIAITMLISIGIGFYFSFTGTKQKTTSEFLMASRSMGRFPVVFSLVVTKLSAIAIIGEPSDIYLYGTQRCIGFIFIFIGSLVTAYVFLPVYFAVGVSTIYEYLDRRYGRKTRRLISIFGYIQTLLNMSVVIIAPSIAMSVVTEISSETSVILIGGVCIVFSAMGGLKAVMWADVFQAVMMYSCLIALLIQGMHEAGGASQVYEAAYAGQRMEFFKFLEDPMIPYTFWNSIAFGIQFGLTHGVNQFEVQRLLAVKNLKHSQSAELWSSIPSFLMSFLITTAGLTLYALFKDCDPLSPKSGLGLTKADQIVPYYIVSRLAQYPGLAGLCISGILCASISSLSSALNSLATIFVEDFIKISIKQSNVPKYNLHIWAKVLVVVHGLVIIGLAFLTSMFKSILQAVIVLDGMILGPSLAIYLLGATTESTNETGALIGLVSGALFAAWFGLGAGIFGPNYPGKPLSTDGCIPSHFNTSDPDCCDFIYFADEMKNTTDPSAISQFFPLHKMSYAWTYCIGGAITIIVAYLSSCIINHKKGRKPVESRLLSPLVRRCFRLQMDENEAELGKQVSLYGTSGCSGDPGLQHSDCSFLTVQKFQ